MSVIKKSIFGRTPNLFLVFNFILVSCYLAVPDTALLAFDWYSSLGLTGWPCVSAWGNASLEYRIVLYVSAPQTLLLTIMGGLIELFLLKRFPDNGVVNRLRPVPILVIAIPLGVIWFCVLGSEKPIIKMDELGTYHKALFNSGIGVLTVTTLGSSLGVEVGRAIGSLTP